MPLATAESSASLPDCELVDAYRAVRSRSAAICAPLATEDYVVQGMSDVSPPKWHLAHTTWFFENFLLRPFCVAYRPLHSAY